MRPTLQTESKKLNSFIYSFVGSIRIRFQDILDRRRYEIIEMIKRLWTDIRYNRSGHLN
jgi:hypothetical protein